MGEQAAFVAQKPAVDYCRVKAGLTERLLFEDPDFLAALAHCRWQTFAAATPDILALAEGWLRPHARNAEPDLAAALARIGRDVLDQSPAPEAERATLDATAAALEAHLLAQQVAPPQGADRRPINAQATLLATLPVHPDQRRGETVAITGALRFQLVAAQQRMEKRFDAPALARALVP
ncbi:hypothetical protein [Falsiroseomonas sp. E2-1-a20]|uniref:hypothetical protein n=1 Tax=Falsiroseomonas sp. E2-1-a20 TaxID=3239300 RepID=UPI003F2F5196